MLNDNIYLKRRKGNSVLKGDRNSKTIVEFFPMVTEFFIFTLPGFKNRSVALPNLFPMTQHHYYKDQIMYCDLDSLAEG